MLSVVSLFFSVAFYAQSTTAYPISLSISIDELGSGLILGDEFNEVDLNMLNDSAMHEDPLVVQYNTEVQNHQGEVNGIVTLSVLLSDTNDVTKVHYKIGRSHGQNDLIESNILFDDNQVHGAITYNRTQNQIRLVLGMYNNIGDLYGEVYIEDSQGQLSSVIQAEYHK